MLNKAKNYFKKILQIRNGYDSNVGRNNRNNREKWLENELSKLTLGSRILDAGAGELQYKKFCKHLQYTSQDFGEFKGNEDNIGMHQSEIWDSHKVDIISDIINIPVPDESFDAIMCIEVFEHLPEPIKAIKEFFRILKKDGILLITAPTISLTHQEPFYFYSGFSKYFYEHHLNNEGFKIEEISENGNYFEFLAQELRRANIVAKEYSEQKRTGKEIKATGIVLKMLSRFSSTGDRSKLLTSFGYHVKAIKTGNVNFK
jgi:ubiquinone/menaquinone biosynthesis C-methylase UbiE